MLVNANLIRYHIRRTILSERMCSMPQQPDPADPGRDDDLAWLDRDPMTAEEREAWLDRVCEEDGPPDPEEYEDFTPLTAAELAEIRQLGRRRRAAGCRGGHHGAPRPGATRFGAGVSG
jgi:hypothetical protein